MFEAGEKYDFSVFYFILAVGISCSAELSMKKVLLPWARCVGFVLGLCFVSWFLVLAITLLRKRERAGCFM